MSSPQTVFLLIAALLIARYEARKRLVATNPNDTVRKSTSSVRRCAAADMEMPRPVASASYATTQAGHLGSRASVALGTIQPAISRPRSHHDAGRRALYRPRVAVWQQ